MIDVAILKNTLREGREAARDRMGLDNAASLADLYRPTGRGAQDEGTGLQEKTFTPTYTGLPMRLGGAPADSARYSTTTVTEGVQVMQALRTAHLPHTTDDLADGDLIHIIAGENADTWWQIQDTEWQDQSTARRVQVREAQAPRELREEDS